MTENKKQFRVESRDFDTFAEAETYAKLNVKGYPYADQNVIWEKVAVVAREERETATERKIVTTKV